MFSRDSGTRVSLRNKVNVPTGTIRHFSFVVLEKDETAFYIFLLIRCIVFHSCIHYSIVLLCLNKCASFSHCHECNTMFSVDWVRSA